MPVTYTTPWGNDTKNSGLNIYESKRTLLSGITTAAGSTAFATGYYNETYGAGGAKPTGFRLLQIDGTSLGTSLTLFPNNGRVYNASLGSSGGTADGLRLVNNPTSTGGISFSSLKNSLIAKTPAAFTITSTGQNTVIGTKSSAQPLVLNLGVNSINDIYCDFNGGTTSDGIAITNITSATNTKFQYYQNCRFRFNGGTGTNETTYTLPTGADDAARLANLRSRCVAVYGGVASDYFQGCAYSSATTNTNIFIDPANENYYLVPNCTPSKMAFNGKYVGLFPEAFVSTVSGSWTLTNVDTSGNILDQRKLATLVSPIINFGVIRKITSFEAIGSLAVRNGNEINQVLTILPQPKIYTNTLTAGKIYKVYNSAITSNGSITSTTHPVGACFIAKNDTTQSLSFFSGSDTYGSSLIAGTILTDLGLYEVEAGSTAIYKGVTYNPTDRFQAYVDLTADPTSNTFSGAGTVKQFNGGFVRQIYDYTGVSGITAGTALRDKVSYLVTGGTSVTYLSSVYTPGQVLTCLASSSTAFTSVGGATLTEYYVGFVSSLEVKSSKTDATLSGLSFYKYSMYDAPQANYDVNGAVSAGNVDSGFVRAQAQDLTALAVQYRILVQPINIT